MKKLVIEISEEDYKECIFRKDLLSLGGEPTDLTFNMRMEKLIAKAIPLEKELENIKKEFEDRILLNQTVAIQIIDRRIAELKENNKENEDG